MNENILSLVKAGFSAEEIRIIAPEAFVSSASEPPSVSSNGQPAAEPAVPAEAVELPETAPAEPAAAESAPAWFADYERQHNEQIAQLQRALQVQNVRRADEPAANQKTQEDLMREAFLAITN